MTVVEISETPKVKFINRHCWVKDMDKEWQVWLNYALFLSYTKEDKASHRFAAACLALAKAGSKTAIGEAFGYHRNYVARLAAKLQKEGAQGILDGKPGPKGPRKLGHRVRRRIGELRQQGLSHRAIAERLYEEQGIELSHTWVGHLGKETHLEKQNLPQASFNDAWPLILPVQHTVPPAVKVSPAEMTKDKDETKPIVREGREFSGAGGFLFYPALAIMGLVNAFQKVYRRLSCRRYGLRELVLALFFLWVMRFDSVEAFKKAQRRDFGMLLGRPQAPSMETLRRKLQEVATQRQGHQLTLEMARRYADGDIVELGVLYADGHMKPYYGSRSIGEVWSSLRRMGMPGFHQYFINDQSGRPLFFLTAKAQQRSFVHMLPKLVDQIRSVAGEREFTLVFDRGGYSPELFGTLRENGVWVITYRRRPFDPYPAEVFSTQWCEFKGERHEYQLHEEMIQLRKLGPVRNIAVLREDGRQTHILTTDLVREASLVAHLMFNRWGQENFFKYMLEHYTLDALHGYGYEAIAGQLMIINPDRRVIEKEIQELRSRMKTLRTELGTLAARKAAEEQLEPLRQQLTPLEAQLSGLVKRRRQMPRRVPLGETGLKLEGLDLEKKIIMDTIKIAAYNAEAWLLERLEHHYDNPRDIRQVLQVFTQLKGRLELCDHQLIVVLTPPEMPRFRKALEGLCTELNSLSTPFPGTPYHIYFAIAGTPLHTNRHQLVPAMS